MLTVRQLLQEIETLRMKEHIWLNIRDYVESFVPEGSNMSASIEIANVRVPGEVLLEVIADIEAECLGPIQKRINNIEGRKVGDGEKKAPAAKKPKK